MSSIYGLLDPRVGSIRYVGKTIMPIEDRLRDHIYMGTYVLKEMKCAKKTKLNNWLAKMLRDDVEPQIRLLEICDESIEDYLEIEWIANMRLCGGPPMVNGTDGGEGGRWSDEAKAKSSATHKAQWEDFEFRSMMMESFRDRPPHSQETLDKMSKGMLAHWADPAFRAAQRLVQVGHPKGTHCKNGHEWPPDDECLLDKQGYRVCRECKREKSATRRARLKTQREIKY